MVEVDSEGLHADLGPSGISKEEARQRRLTAQDAAPDEGLTLEQESAPKPAPEPARPKVDLFGGKTAEEEAAQRLADYEAAEKRKRDGQAERAARLPDGPLFDGSQQQTDIESVDLEEAGRILEAAGIDGKDRLDAIAKVRRGEYTLDDLRAAFPQKEAAEQEAREEATKPDEAGESASRPDDTAQEGATEQSKAEPEADGEKPAFSLRDGDRPSADDLPPSINRKIIGSDDVLLGWTLLAQDDLSFQLPVSQKKGMGEIFRDIEPGFRVGVSNESAGPRGAKKAWRVSLPNGKEATVYENGKSVWIDVSRLSGGEDGKRIYNAVANYAFNNGKVFMGDPDGLSDVAMSRRLENMISSALKFGTTRHLWPHPRQEKGGAGVQAIRWKDGDDAFNLRQMIDASHRATIAQAPEVAHIIYNPVSDRFEDSRDGSERTDDDFDNLAKAARNKNLWPDRTGNNRAQGKTTAGRTTLMRAAFTGTLLRGTRKEQSALLVRLGGERRQRLAGAIRPDKKDERHPWMREEGSAHE